MGGPSRAIVVDRNRQLARRVARVLVSAGYRAEIREPGEAPQGVPPGAAGRGGGLPPRLLVGDAGAAEEICRELRAESGVAGALYGAGELDAGLLLGEPALQALLALRGPPGRMEIEAELLGLARHLRGAPLPPLQGLLLWGASAFSADIHNVAGREAAVARVVDLCGGDLGASRRIADAVGEIAHELITNAMYDAPVDEGGALRYDRDRTAPIELPAEDRVTFRFGTDGLRLAVEAEDRFGRLRRDDFARSLRRGAAGQVNQAAGGAGIGLSRILRASQAVVVDVEPGRRTRVTALIDLDPPRPDGGARPGRTLVFPERPVAEGSRPSP